MRQLGWIPLGPILTLAALGLASAALGQGIWSGAGFEQEQERSDGDLLEGRFSAIGGAYGEQRIDCVRCHGLEGQGDTSGAFPALAGQGQWYLYKALHDYAQGRRDNEVMTPIARTLSEASMRDLAAYYASLEREWGLTAPQSDTELLQTGGVIAAQGIPEQGVPACSSCHGMNGEGDFPVNPALSGQSAAYLSHQLQLWKQGRRDGDPMDVMEQIAKTMSDDQITAVAHYYAQLSAQEPDPEAGPVNLIPAPITTGGEAGTFAPDTLPPYIAPGQTETDLSPRAAGRSDTGNASQGASSQ